MGYFILSHPDRKSSPRMQKSCYIFVVTHSSGAARWLFWPF